MVVCSLSQEPFKSVPVVWTIHERHLAVRLSSYASNGLTLLINDWNRAFNRATVVVFPNYVLPVVALLTLTNVFDSIFDHICFVKSTFEHDI